MVLPDLNMIRLDEGLHKEIKRGRVEDFKSQDRQVG